jgi:hypothetical protein
MNMWGMNDRTAIPMPQAESVLSCQRPPFYNAILFQMKSFKSSCLPMRCGSTIISILFLPRGLCSNLSFVNENLLLTNSSS